MVSPRESSTHFRRAASEASPFTSLLRTGTPDWPGLNSARLQRAAHLSRFFQPLEIVSYQLLYFEKYS
jgi:hypothetical protein